MLSAMQCHAIFSGDAAVQAQLNGTSPWSVVRPGWAPQPAGRGTMDIIWSCLVTIFACSWTVTHLHFPRGRSSYSSKALLCAIAVVAPEALASMSLSDYLHIRYYSKTIQKMDKGKWTLSQLYFVNMGGVELEFQDNTETLGCNENGVFDNARALITFQRALQLKILDMKSMSVEGVKKRAKANYLVKALVRLQASWLVAQVIGRAVAKLPITTLEVVTTGYVACALTTYCCWWDKPQDAEASIMVNCRSLTKASFHQQTAALQNTPYVASWWDLVSISMVAGTFGAVHCTAWNFFFSTSAEGVIWRVASVLTAVIPCVLAYVKTLEDVLDWLGALSSVLILICPLVRGYLNIETFVAFRSVPVRIFYTVNWSTWIPHI